MSDLRPDEQAEIDDESDVFPDSVTRDFAMAMDAAWLKTKDAPYVDIVREYKAVESIFIPRVADNEVYDLEFRRRVAEAIFKSAADDCKSFETCMAYWDDVVRLGIVQLEARTTMVWFYADCCRRHKQAEKGINMLEPLIAELQRLLAEPNIGEVDAEDYRQQLEIMGKLLAKLEAQRK
jgi:hypothetical protein